MVENRATTVVRITSTNWPAPASVSPDQFAGKKNGAIRSWDEAIEANRDRILKKMVPSSLEQQTEAQHIAIALMNDIEEATPAVIALAILRMIKPPGRVEQGSIWLGSRDLLAVSEEQMEKLRLAEVALITQGSMNSLNPVLRVRDQIADGLQDHGAPVWYRNIRVKRIR